MLDSDFKLYKVKKLFSFPMLWDSWVGGCDIEVVSLTVL